MVNPLIILTIIGVVIGGIWAGISSVVYDANGTAKIPFLSFIPKFPIDFNALANPTPTNATLNATYDWQKLFVENPLQTILSDLGHITTSVINYISSPMQWLFTFLVHWFCKTCVLPNYTGLLISILIFFVFLFFTYETIISIVGKVTVIGLVIISLLLLLVVLLSFFGVIH